MINSRLKSDMTGAQKKGEVGQTAFVFFRLALRSLKPKNRLIRSLCLRRQVMYSLPYAAGSVHKSELL